MSAARSDAFDVALLPGAAKGGRSPTGAAPGSNARPVLRWLRTGDTCDAARTPYQASRRIHHPLPGSPADLPTLRILCLWQFERGDNYLDIHRVILEQCQLFTKGEIPFAFITWALVNDEVDMRLRAGIAKLAPHEWKGGEHAWLIDVVSPFEKAEPYVNACCERFVAGKKVSRLVAGSERTRWRRLAVMCAEGKGKNGTCHRAERRMDRAYARELLWRSLANHDASRAALRVVLPMV